MGLSIGKFNIESTIYIKKIKKIKKSKLKLLDFKDLKKEMKKG